MSYPDVDTELSGYVACIAYESCRVLALPGWHQSYVEATRRAGASAAALRAAGETGVRGHVGYGGERPAGFPRNGVTA